MEEEMFPSRGVFLQFLGDRRREVVLSSRAKDDRLCFNPLLRRVGVVVLKGEGGVGRNQDGGGGEVGRK